MKDQHKNIPKLRFPEFDEPWEEKKLNDQATFFKGKGLSKNSLTEVGEDCILYGELYTKYGFEINRVLSKTSELIENPIIGHKNDVLVPSSGETPIDIACASALNVEPVILGGDLNVIRPKNEINGTFISYQINGKYKEKLSTYAQGKSVVHLYNESIKNMNIAFPSYKEQNKISSFFSRLDKQIEFEEKKLHLLMERKKGYMQKIFSRKLRFKDEAGEDFPDWIEYKLSDISERITRKNKGLISQLPLTISAQYGLVDQLSFFNKSVAGVDLEGYYLLKNGEFAYNKSYSAGYPYGAIKKLDLYEEGLLSTLYICFRIKGNVNTNFLAQYFESTKWHKQIVNISGEGARNHGLLNIAVGDFFETRHILPCFEEQEKIAMLLDKLDEKVKKQKKKLDLLKQQKKGLMQLMFI